MCAFFLDALDLLLGVLHIHALFFQKFYALLEILPLACNIQDQHAFSSREDLGVENIERQIVFFNQLATQRFVNDGFWKSEDKYFRVHVIVSKL